MNGAHDIEDHDNENGADGAPDIEEMPFIIVEPIGLEEQHAQVEGPFLRIVCTFSPGPSVAG